jgi:hypothetical protein
MIDRKQFLRALAAGAAAGLAARTSPALAAATAVATPGRGPRRTPKGGELLLTDAIVITMDGARRACRSRGGCGS